MRRRPPSGKRPPAPFGLGQGRRDLGTRGSITARWQASHAEQTLLAYQGFPVVCLEVACAHWHAGQERKSWGNCVVSALCAYDSYMPMRQVSVTCLVEHLPLAPCLRLKLCCMYGSRPGGAGSGGTCLVTALLCVCLSHARRVWASCLPELDCLLAIPLLALCMRL